MLRVAVETIDGVLPPFDDGWFERVVRAAASSHDLGDREFASPVSGTQEEDLEVVVLLADDQTLHDLNRNFRGKDAPTDVLSFEGDAGSILATLRGGPRHLGDVALSVERARKQAEEYGHSFEREVSYLITHGVLHLLGHDHEADEDQAAMRQAEERALLSLGLTRAA